MALNRFHRSLLGGFVRSPLGARGVRSGVWTLFGTCATRWHPPPEYGVYAPPPIYIKGQWPPGTLIVSDHDGEPWCMKAMLQTGDRVSAFDTLDESDVSFSSHAPVGGIDPNDLTVTISGVTASACCWDVCAFSCPNVLVTDISDVNGGHSVTRLDVTGELACETVYTGFFDVGVTSYSEGQGCSGTPFASTTNSIQFWLRLTNRHIDCKPHVEGTAQGGGIISYSMLISGALCNGPGFFQCYPIRATLPNVMAFNTAYPIEWQNFRTVSPVTGTRTYYTEGNCADDAPLIGGTVTVSWNP